MRRCARELARADTELRCQAENVDRLMAGLADECAPRICSLPPIYDNLRPGDYFGEDRLADRNGAFHAHDAIIAIGSCSRAGNCHGDGKGQQRGEAVAKRSVVQRNMSVLLCLPAVADRRQNRR
jgi:hypothetical protein